MTLFITALTLLTLTALVVLIPAIRRPLISRPLLARFRKVLPPMSAHEREALDAGGTWWDAELFSGRPDWDRLQALASTKLSPAERTFLNGPVQELCRRLNDWQIAHEEQDLPEPIWRFLKQERFFALVIPREYGGLGFSALAHSEIVLTIASRSVAAAVTVMVPSSLGPAGLLLRYGTDAQRRHWLPRLARGADIPCFALTGPNAGSDAASIPDVGRVCKARFDGREQLAIRLDFDKRYITLGPIATLIGLAFRLQDPDHLLGDDPEPGITLALVPASTPGVEQGERHWPMGLAFQNGPLRGRGVLVPLDAVIGGRGGVGRGWAMLMEALAEGRGISLPALSTGAGKLAARYSGAYARVRRQFGRPIGQFEGVRQPLARIAGLTYQMEAARRVFLDALCAGERPAVLSAVLKYQLTERFRRVINDAMDIHGGSGICLGPSNLVGPVYQSIPIAITVEGANILTRNMILFGQGAMRCHPHLRHELAAAYEPDRAKALRGFDKAIAGHLGFLLGNMRRSLWLGLTRARLARPRSHGITGRYSQLLSWLASAFALNADLVMMTMGGSLKRRERISARLGDVLSGLYMASAQIKWFDACGRPSSDQDLFVWAMEEHLVRIREAFQGLWANLSMRPLGWLLRALSFPTGQSFRGPTDRMDQAAARLLLRSNEARERLTAGVFVPDAPDEPLALMERAFEAVQRADEIQSILKAARALGRITHADGPAAIAEAVAERVITPADAKKLERAETLRAQVIAVDSFHDIGTSTALHDQRQAA